MSSLSQDAISPIKNPPTVTRSPTPHEAPKTAAPVDIVEQGIAAVEGGHPHPIPQPLPPAENIAIDIKPMVQAATVGKLPKHTTEQKQIVGQLFLACAPHEHGEALSQQLEQGVIQYNGKTHSFQIGEHLFVVTKGLSHIGAIAIRPDQVFASGTFGELYELKTAEPAERLIALKLLKPDALPEHKEDLLKEFKVMKFIEKRAETTVGLNTKVFGLVSYNGQLGVLLNKATDSLWNFAAEGKINSEIKPQQCHSLTEQTSKGLASLHQLGIIHRDVKPQNIVLTKRGEAWEAGLIDFGNCCFVREIYDLIRANPKITAKELMNGCTEQFTSQKYMDEIDALLSDIRGLQLTDAEISGKIAKIIELMKKNDEFALALCHYVQWTSTLPTFGCMLPDAPKQFCDWGTKEENKEIIEDMEEALRFASYIYAGKTFTNEEGTPDDVRIMKQIVDAILEGMKPMPGDVQSVQIP